MWSSTPPEGRSSDEKTLGHFAADAFQQSLEAIPGQIWGTEEMVSFHMCMRVYINYIYIYINA